jgi:hypothetical protein
MSSAITHTATGNLIRRSALSNYGTPVRSLSEAVNAIGFSITQEPITRAATGTVIPGELGLFRSDNGGCLGIHSPNFSFLQPADSLATLERARQIVGGEWCSASTVKGGRMLAAFIQIDTAITAPRRGDKIGLSVAYFDRFDGAGRARLQLLANVLACDNGMTRQDSLVSFAEKHTGSLKDRFAALEIRLSVNLQEQVEEMRGIVGKLDNWDMTPAEVDGFARALFPAQDEQDVSARVQASRDEVISGFVRGAGNVGRTRWDAFNAVTEFLDHRSTFRETEFSRAENRFESIISGTVARTRSRALELLLN